MIQDPPYPDYISFNELTGEYVISEDATGKMIKALQEWIEAEDDEFKQLTQIPEIETP